MMMKQKNCQVRSLLICFISIELKSKLEESLFGGEAEEEEEEESAIAPPPQVFSFNAFTYSMFRLDNKTYSETLVNLNLKMISVRLLWMRMINLKNNENTDEAIKYQMNN